ncbi:MAG: molecular chaperone HtpG [Muribaculaceae bacterium]|nr:molecular chaperone HtpG [Muribaculaceae bacterium]
MTTGKIGVTTENIFPVIKKFLYSDHEIFLRELVSNAVDATQKIRTLSSFGEFKGELGTLDVRVDIDKEKGTLTVTDRGIGMDKEDVDKYINQIAFSGAEEFLQKYKDNANNIIGHFGLGFYSAFMVSKKVEIRSLSYKEGAKGVLWTCDGSPEYSMEECDKSDRGTEITLYLDDDSKEFLEQARIDTLLKKYCRFLPVPVISGKKQEWKDGKMVDTDQDNVVNATEPLWTKKPADLKDEDYLKFYHELMPGMDDPMFWIHLNVDYPFTLTGILYFPKIKNEFDIRKDRIQLYSNQVYVTDQVEGVVPEFMTLMQGVIDSPDIPLNVSRSYLQADTAVKKISGYISKKVAEKLDSMFKSDRKAFEAKWDDIKVFIEYGMLTDEKFFEAARKFYLLKDVEGKYFTLEEYHTLVEGEQKDKDGHLVYLYATDKTAQHSFIQAAEAKGYSVLLLDGQLGTHIVGLLESKLEGISFVRVDSDTPERLIRKTEDKGSGLTANQTEVMTIIFKSQIPEVEKAQFVVGFDAISSEAAPATVTQNEFMRRMQEMAAMQPGMAFYGEMPANYSFTVNTDQPAVKTIIEETQKNVGDKADALLKQIAGINEEISKASQEAKEKNQSVPEMKEQNEKVASLRAELEKEVSDYASTLPKVKQIIDLALLQSGLLKGASLSEFIRRTASLL